MLKLAPQLAPLDDFRVPRHPNGLVPARPGRAVGQGVSPQSPHSCRVQLPGPLAVGGQIGPGVARLGVGQGLLVPIRIARSWEAEHRPLPGRGPLDDLEPV